MQRNNKENERNINKNEAEEYQPFICDPELEAGKNIEDSMQCTRTGSVQSLNSNSNMVIKIIDQIIFL